MGNDFSSDTNKASPKNTVCKYCDEDVDYLRDIYGRTCTCKNISSDYHNRKYSNQDNSVFVNNRGVALAYLPAMHSLNHAKNQHMMSDKITEVEIAICNANGLNETVEKHKVNKHAPNYSCGDKNCYCVKKTIISSRNNNRKQDLFDSISDNVQEIHKLVEQQSRQPMFPGPKNIGPTYSKKSYPSQIFSATSSDMVPANIPYSATSPNNLNNSTTSPYNPINTPSNLTTSPGMPAVNIKMAGGAKKKANKKHNASSSLSLSLSSSSDGSSDSSDSIDYKQSRPKSKSKHNSKIDTNSSDDGILLSDSSITTSDLYKIQKKIFNTEPTTESGEDSMEYTEKVNRAINRMETHKGIFSSESKEILGLSDSEKYTNKKAHKNKKYAGK